MSGELVRLPPECSAPCFCRALPSRKHNPPRTARAQRRKRAVHPRGVPARRRAFLRRRPPATVAARRTGRLAEEVSARRVRCPQQQKLQRLETLQAGLQGAAALARRRSPAASGATMESLSRLQTVDRRFPRQTDKIFPARKRTLRMRPRTSARGWARPMRRAARPGAHRLCRANVGQALAYRAHCRKTCAPVLRAEQVPGRTAEELRPAPAHGLTARKKARRQPPRILAPRSLRHCLSHLWSARRAKTNPAGSRRRRPCRGNCAPCRSAANFIEGMNRAETSRRSVRRGAAPRFWRPPGNGTRRFAAPRRSAPRRHREGRAG